MSIGSTAHHNSPMHPQEGECIVLSLGAAAQVAVDLTPYIAGGAKVGIYYHVAPGGNFLGYKFSDSPVANVSVAANPYGNASACMIMGPQQVREAFIPKGKPYLHMQSGVAATVTISRVSQVRR